MDGWRCFTGMGVRKKGGEKLQVRGTSPSLRIFCSEEKQRNGAANAGGKAGQGFYFLLSL